ncbi:MAG: cytochrome c [Alphaproteobacteria bacterium]|nr:cytochrome c [Alphaproteobacteria bacterium]
MPGTGFRFAVAAMMASGLWLDAASADWAGDATADGRILAQRWCASCHVVDPAQSGASDVAPPFVHIANDPTKTSEGLKAWLADPHPPMPQLNLDQYEIDSLVAYIESLRGN